MSDDRTANLRMIYAEVADSFHRVDDFRVRLLALLPLFSGAGIFLMLDPKVAGIFGSGIASSGAEASRGAEVSSQSTFAPYIGSFGALATLGLFIYELRGIRRCNILVRLGKQLECQLGVVGTFSVKSKDWLIGATAAGFVVYATVLGGWVFLAASQLGAPMAATWAAVASAVLLVSSIVLQRCKQLDPPLPSPTILGVVRP